MRRRSGGSGERAESSHHAERSRPLPLVIAVGYRVNSDVFRVRQDRELVSDFDRIVEGAKRLGEGKAKKRPRKEKKR